MQLLFLSPTTGFTKTTIVYDLAGRKLGMDDPDMGVWTYAYDALGQLTSQVDARGCITSFTVNDN